MAGTDFLPKGLKLVQEERPPKWIPIAQADAEGPVFEIQMAYMGYRRFRDSMMDDGDGARTTQAAINAQRKLLDKVILGWKGLTLENLVEILRIEGTIQIDVDAKGAGAFKEGDELPFDRDTLWMLYQNAWPEAFQNVIMLVLRNWKQDIEKGARAGKDD